MIYQLPNGKVIHLSVEEYLDLTDNDIQYLMSINAGDYARSPFVGSAIRDKRKKSEEEEERDEDHSIDFTPESDEPFTGHNTDSEEEYPDFPEDMTSIV
jgi:hypothetical protein